MGGRLDELASKVVAHDGEGPVTALEVLLYLDITRSSAADMPVSVWLGEDVGEDAQAGERIGDAIARYLAIRSLARKAGVAAPASEVERELLFTAIEAAYVDRVVLPEIVVEEVDVHRYYIAHSNEYTEAPQAQVRYIFVPLPENANREERNKAEASLAVVRGRIEAGEVSFDEAARGASRASSREQGGLIPAFSRGTHFAEFEHHAFALKRPGRLSPVFFGRGGVYLLQLVSSVPERQRIALGEVSDQIRAGLRTEHVRPYYETMVHSLRVDRRPENFARYWAYAHPNTPVARVGLIELTRDDLMRMNPNVINLQYELNWSAIVTEARRWIEGELVASDWESRGLGSHAYIETGRAVLGRVLAARLAIRRRISRERFASAEAALATLRAGSPVESGIPEARVLKISFIPDSLDEAATSQRRLQRDRIGQIAAIVRRGALPTEPLTQGFIVTLTGALAEGEDRLADSLFDVQELLKATELIDLRVTIADAGWQYALANLSAHPSIEGLSPGEIGGLQWVGSAAEMYAVVGLRSADSEALLAHPLLLKSAAYEVETGRLIEEEIKRIGGLRGQSALPPGS